MKMMNMLLVVSYPPANIQNPHKHTNIRKSYIKILKNLVKILIQKKTNLGDSEYSSDRVRNLDVMNSESMRK